MPVPQEHKQNLERLLSGMTDENGKKLAPHLRSPQFQKAIDDLHDSHEARQEATRDPKGYFKRKGADLPDEVTIEVVQGSWCINFNMGGFCIVRWCDDKGWTSCY